MHRSTIITLVTSAGLGLLTAGCATAAPSSQLVNARSHYQAARTGEAQQYEPELVHDAGQALRDAEAVHDRKPGSYQEEHLAYVADRLALYAMSEGRYQDDKERIAQADQRREEVLLSQRDTARTRLDSAQGEIGQTNQALDMTSQQLDEERRARQTAEQELQAAMASLSEIANIKADQQNVVITLSGSVLFKTNEATLLPIARERLSRVAEVLREQDDKTFVVEGHTDSRGPSGHNEDLSLARADSVRSFLVSEGVPTDRIKAVGRGESEPVASNDSADGRANNRRVEIVVSDRVKTAQR